MPWVLMTAFGAPVEPEVNRNFAIVSGPTAANARETASLSGVARMSAAATPPTFSAFLPATTTARWLCLIAASAAAKGAASAT